MDDKRAFFQRQHNSDLFYNQREEMKRRSTKAAEKQELERKMMKLLQKHNEQNQRQIKEFQQNQNEAQEQFQNQMMAIIRSHLELNGSSSPENSPQTTRPIQTATEKAQAQQLRSQRSTLPVSRASAGTIQLSKSTDSLTEIQKSLSIRLHPLASAVASSTSFFRSPPDD